MLYLHQPTFTQGLWRWWEGDSKDDLYYLFHAIRRYYKWYKNEDNKIYDYIGSNLRMTEIQSAIGLSFLKKLDIDIIYRNKAKFNDDIYVTGNLGDSFIGLKILQKKINVR